MEARPSPWIEQQRHHFPKSGEALDLACGNGRHGRWLMKLGFQVTFLDQNTSGVADLLEQPGCRVIEFDLEQGRLWTPKHPFDLIVVCNYLHRPLLPLLADWLNPKGILVYETFMQGHERHGRPKNPDFLLTAGELPAVLSPALNCLASFEAEPVLPEPAVRQGYCGLKPAGYT